MHEGVKCEISPVAIERQSLQDREEGKSLRRIPLLREFQFNDYGFGMFLLAVLSEVPIHMTNI